LAQPLPGRNSGPYIPAFIFFLFLNYGRRGKEFKRGHPGLLKTRPGSLFARPGGLFCYYYVAPRGERGTANKETVKLKPVQSGFAGLTRPQPSQFCLFYKLLNPLSNLLIIRFFIGKRQKTDRLLHQPWLAQF